MEVTKVVALLLTSIHYITACPAFCQCSGKSVSCPDSAIIPDGIPNNTASLSFTRHLFMNLPSYTFVPHRLLALDILQLEYGNLEVIGPYAFHGLPHLTALHLRSNHINSIDPKAFDGLSHVTVLYLTGNKLQQLKPQQFQGLDRLSWISLSENEIETIQPKAFQGLYSLRSLYLRSNSISEITSYQAFSGLDSLTQLSIKNNDILQHIGDRVFAQLPNLEKLELGGNQISAESLTEGTFAGLDSLRLLDLSSNPLAAVPSVAFKAIPQLRVLYLSAADLEFIQPGAFTYLPNLMEINLEKNYHLHSIADDCFHNTPDMQILRLSGTNIKELRANMFMNITRVYRLLISKTQLSKVHPNLFVNLTNIRDLDLSDNQLTSLPSDVFASIPYTPSLHIDLRNNPWSCDCHLPGFIATTNQQYTAAQRKKIFTISKNQPQCSNPPHLAQKPIFNVSISNLTCVQSSASSETNSKAIFITVGCLSTLVAIATIFAISVSWRKCKQSKLSHSVQYGSRQNIMSLPLDDDVSVNEANI